MSINAMMTKVFQEGIEKNFAAGLNTHVGKPIDFDDMMDTMARYLE